MSWEPVNLPDQEPFSIELLVKRFGNWHLGYAWVPLYLGGAPLGPCLALYACKEGARAERYICGGIKECMVFWERNKVPPRKAAQVMGEAIAKAPREVLGRYI